MFELPPSLLLLIVLFSGLFIVLKMLFSGLPLGRRQHAIAAEAPDPDQGTEADPLLQLAAVRWTVKRLMGASEFRRFRKLEALVVERRAGHRLFSQVSIGEILRVDPASGSRSARMSAFNRINAKRVDFLIVDRSGFPVAAVEYQGADHYRGNAAMRDAIKREAFRLAGVPFVEIPKEGLGVEQVTELRRLLGLDQPVAAE